MEQRRRIDVTCEELQLLKELDLPFDVNARIVCVSVRKTTVAVSDDEASVIVDASGDKLLMEGFDEDYEPNDVGTICEHLIDKFVW